MENFHHILNWNLKSGSHEFPGPDGGTCINEAAIVAAGFEYRSVDSAEDCPPCFSRPCATYAIGINDAMPDKLRQELLLPFVTRLAGSADTPEIERQRAELMFMRTVKEILPIVLRLQENEMLACQCEAVTNLAEAKKANAKAAAASAAYTAANANANANADAYADAYAAAYAKAADAYTAAYAAETAAYAARAAYGARKKIWTIAASILDEALRIGKQADAIEIGVVKERMEAIKAKRDLETTNS